MAKYIVISVALWVITWRGLIAVSGTTGVAAAVVATVVVLVAAAAMLSDRKGKEAQAEEK